MWGTRARANDAGAGELFRRENAAARAAPGNPTLAPSPRMAYNTPAPGLPGQQTEGCTSDV